jgi:uncharacterized protein YggE
MRKRREGMKRRWFLAVSLALMLGLGILVGCSPDSTLQGGIEGINISNQQQGIWITGQGKVTAVPDIITLSLGVESQGVSVAMAQSQAAEAMDKVMTALTDNGVAEKDIQTQYFSIRKVSRWDREKEEEVVIGYQVTNTVTAKIRDIDKAGSIIDRVALAGGDLTRINNVGFSIDDPSDYYVEAREMAMADAKDKANRLAELADVTLDKPIFISESSWTPPITRDVMAMAEAPTPAPATPITPGEMEISLNVQVVYAIH